MTEIEKAHMGKRSVHLNKIAKELEKEFDELYGMMKDCARRKLAGEQFSMETWKRLSDSSADVMLSVNAMINKVNADELLRPVLVAGVVACADLLKGTFDDVDRELIEKLSEIIISRATVRLRKHEV